MMRRELYPADWPAISLRIRERACWRCQWCGAVNGLVHPGRTKFDPTLRRINKMTTNNEEVEITEEITPDTPRNRQVLASIREGIALLGWEEYEKQLVEALSLHLATETDEKRFYAGDDGQIQIIFTTIKGPQ